MPSVGNVFNYSKSGQQQTQQKLQRKEVSDYFL